jgi:hypothetical protein
MIHSLDLIIPSNKDAHSFHQSPPRDSATSKLLDQYQSKQQTKQKEASSTRVSNLTTILINLFPPQENNQKTSSLSPRKDSLYTSHNISLYNI